MGISGMGPGSLILILAIVLLIFGTKRLRNMGGDAGSALKGFKTAMKGEDADSLIEEESDDSLKSEVTQSKVAEKEKKD